MSTRHLASGSPPPGSLALVLAPLVLVLLVVGCSSAQQAGTAPTPTEPPAAAATGASERRTPSTSSAQVTIEPTDRGMTAVRDLFEALEQGDDEAAWTLLGPRTRDAVGRSDVGELRDLLAPLLSDELAPFDDVIVAQTPDVATHLVVLGDRETAEPVAAEVVVDGADRTVEVSPPVRSKVGFDIERRRIVEVSTPAADQVELLVDGFHFRPLEGADGEPAVMNLPFPLTPRTHVFGAWYREGDGTTGVGAATIRVSEG